MARKAPTMSPGMKSASTGKTTVRSTMTPVFARGKGRKKASGRRGGR